MTERQKDRKPKSEMRKREKKEKKRNRGIQEYKNLEKHNSRF
jgi:hypothetical protein